MRYAGRRPVRHPDSPDSADPADLLLRLREAEAAVRARDDFLAIAAHELRSPLNALSLRLRAPERLAQRSAEPALQDGPDRAARSVDRYVRRAVTLLDLSRMQAGALVPTCTQVSGSDLLQNVVDGYRDEAEFHGAQLQGVALQEVTGWWDAHMVEQVPPTS
ncbi:HAMP domain-containing histidine kinase [Ramlibacter terrae]|uniref:histidine kinase n=1 Tax=Ramlibacter terrae TaxID=2732511 RepID=A0ABX6P1H6_9BURK|nr:HAMP domain-containing histidine kinase [Ramlibacter terrae]